MTIPAILAIPIRALFVAVAVLTGVCVLAGILARAGYGLVVDA